jgi:predicted SAM-dependent methyltransferase
MTPIYLHLGCGDRKFDGFINVDLDSPGADMHLDLTQPLPWGQGTVSGIYSEHFIEHITQAAGIRLLMECRRVLKPGGVVRIATPDLVSIVEEYRSGHIHSDWATFNMGWTANQCERLNIAMRWWDHKWIYDEEELTRIGVMAGLKLVGRYKIGESNQPAFKNREYRASSELILEFVKPDRQPDLTNPPLVSILIPSFSKRYFAQALESAINQTYQNLEILISDDCANTDIEEIVKPYAQKDSRIRYVKHTSELARKDYGRSNSDDCFKMAKGEFIKFLYDDDLLAPECVSRMVESFAAHPDIALVTSKRQIINDKGEFLPDIGATQAIVQEDSLINGLSMGLALVGEPTTAMFRKADLEDATPDIMSTDNVQIGGIGDVSMWMHLLTKGDAIYLTDTLSYFRTHPHQVQATLRTEAEQAAKDGWDVLLHSWRRRGLLPG